MKKRKLEIVVFEDKTAVVKVDGKALPDVNEVFFHGVPAHYTCAIKQFARDEDGRLTVDEDTCTLASKTTWVDEDYMKGVER